MTAIAQGGGGGLQSGRAECNAKNCGKMAGNCGEIVGEIAVPYATLLTPQGATLLDKRLRLFLGVVQHGPQVSQLQDATFNITTEWKQTQYPIPYQRQWFCSTSKNDHTILSRVLIVLNPQSHGPRCSKQLCISGVSIIKRAIIKTPRAGKIDRFNEGQNDTLCRRQHEVTRTARDAA